MDVVYDSDAGHFSAPSAPRWRESVETYQRVMSCIRSTPRIRWYVDGVELEGRRRLAIDHGDAKAQFLLGLCRWYGRLVDEDHAKAFEWWRLAEAQGCLSSRGALCFYADGSTESDRAKAVRLWHAAIREDPDNAPVLLWIGWMMETGHAGEEDRSKGYYEKAASKHYPPAFFNLGVIERIRAENAHAEDRFVSSRATKVATSREVELPGHTRTQSHQEEHEAGDGAGGGDDDDGGAGGMSAMDEPRVLPAAEVLDDISEKERGAKISNIHAILASRYFTTAAELGYAPAHRELGYLATQGLGTPLDLEAALEHFSLAHRLGQDAALFDIGMLYYQGGPGVAQDLSRAFVMFERALAAGVPGSASTLGYMLEEGEGCTQDTERARAMYARAVEEGDSAAMFNLGLMYHDGRAVPTDVGRAVALYKAAAAQGHARANRFMAMLMAEQGGVMDALEPRMSPQDRRNASRGYMRAAAEAGFPEAVEEVIRELVQSTAVGPSTSRAPPPSYEKGSRDVAAAVSLLLKCAKGPNALHQRVSTTDYTLEQTLSLAFGFLDKGWRDQGRIVLKFYGSDIGLMSPIRMDDTDEDEDMGYEDMGYEDMVYDGYDGYDGYGDGDDDDDDDDEDSEDDVLGIIGPDGKIEPEHDNGLETPLSPMERSAVLLVIHQENAWHILTPFANQRSSPQRYPHWIYMARDVDGKPFFHAPLSQVLEMLMPICLELNNWGQPLLRQVIMLYRECNMAYHDRYVRPVKSFTPELEPLYLFEPVYGIDHLRTDFSWRWWVALGRGASDATTEELQFKFVGAEDHHHELVSLGPLWLGAARVAYALENRWAACAALVLCARTHTSPSPSPSLPATAPRPARLSALPMEILLHVISFLSPWDFLLD